MVRARKRKLLVTSLARIYRGFEVRRNHPENFTRNSAAVVIQALFRGKGRVRRFLRRTSWDMVALTGQRIVRGTGRKRFSDSGQGETLCARCIQN